jgi:hypothetical protein
MLYCLDLFRLCSSKFLSSSVSKGKIRNQPTPAKKGTKGRRLTQQTKQAQQTTCEQGMASQWQSAEHKVPWQTVVRKPRRGQKQHPAGQYGLLRQGHGGQQSKTHNVFKRGYGSQNRTGHEGTTGHEGICIYKSG